MQQAEALLELIESLHDRLPGLSFGMYSGYSETELSGGHYWCRSESARSEKQRVWRSIRAHLDFAVFGRFAAGQPSALSLRTSATQKLVLFSERYHEPEFEPQQVEIHIDTQGTVQVTGFPIAGIPA